MNKKEALKILHETQKWRRRRNGVGFDPMPYSHKEFGESIDFAIAYMRRTDDEHK